MRLEQHDHNLWTCRCEGWRLMITEADWRLLRNCLEFALGAQDNAMEPLATDEETAFIEALLAEGEAVNILVPLEG